jgi:hypothetical protein
MKNWPFKIRGLGYLAVEFAIGLASVAVVVVFAKYGL